MTITIETVSARNPELTMRRPRAVPQTLNGVSVTRALWSGPLANPRRIRLTAPGNPVHR